MSAKVVAYTQPTEEFRKETEVESISELIAYCARVSNPSNQKNKETMPKLIQYLANEKHWSPFEMVNVVMEIEGTRDIGRQLLRHRSFTIQEYSQRYANPLEDLRFEVSEARLQDMKNRQNSIEVDDDDLNRRWEEKQKQVIHWAREAYKWAVASGIAKEQARKVLPEGLTLSRMYVNGTIRSWIHYISVRSSQDTQKEHRQLSIDCANELIPLFENIQDFVSG